MRYTILALTGIMFFFSACQKEKSLELGNPAQGSLQDDSGDCLPKNINGNYIASRALIDSNYIDVTLLIEKPGYFSIFTDTVNGYSFKAQGNFNDTGMNVVRLRGTGTPTAAGSDAFTVFFDSSFCSIIVNVLPAGTTPPPSSGGTHFPLTANSWWSYDDSEIAGDTLKVLNFSTITIGPNSYNLFIDGDAPGPGVDSSYFRKSGNDYYEYNMVDNYTVLSFDNTVKGDILFLKEGLTTGQTWNSAEFNGTVGGQALKLRYAFTCTNANQTVTVNGKSFSDVYNITMKPQFSILGSPYQDDVIVWTMYYAKDIGVIYQKADAGGTAAYELQIRNWKVF